MIIMKQQKLGNLGNQFRILTLLEYFRHLRVLLAENADAERQSLVFQPEESLEERIRVFVVLPSMRPNDVQRLRVILEGPVCRLHSGSREVYRIVKDAALASDLLLEIFGTIVRH